MGQALSSYIVIKQEVVKIHLVLDFGLQVDHCSINPHSYTLTRKNVGNTTSLPRRPIN
jgi:hypothetical protein